MSYQDQAGRQIGSMYGTMGVASLFMLGLLGIVADRWVNAERLYGILHLTGAGLLVWASTVRDYETLYERDGLHADDRSSNALSSIRSVPSKCTCMSQRPAIR